MRGEGRVPYYAVDPAEYRKALEDAVRDLYTEEGAAIWWADHDRQAPEEQVLRQQYVMALAYGTYDYEGTDLFWGLRSSSDDTIPPTPTPEETS